MARGLSRTGVPWVVNPPDNEGPGFSWNPITGCLKRCEWCYAWALAKGRLRDRYLQAPMLQSNGNLLLAGDSNDPFTPRWWPSRFVIPSQGRTGPIARKKPAGIFVCNMGELFGPWVEKRYIKAVLHELVECPQHRFYFLTKFPERLRQFNPWPENAWVGATATDEESWRRALLQLASVRAQVRYVSAEPILSSVRPDIGALRASGISWVITGPLNGKLAKQHPCDPRWIREIEAACDTAGVAVFEKPECERLGLGRPRRMEFPT